MILYNKDMFKCVPGVCLIKPQEEDKSGLQTRQKEPSRLLRGTIIEVGADYLTDYGTILKADDYAKIGDEVVFLSYQGEDYDTVYLDNVKYYTVLFKDLRMRLRK